MEDTIINSTAPMPPDDTQNGLAEFVTLGFMKVLYYLNGGRKAQFLVGMWLCRLKHKMGHGAFSEELEHFENVWSVSVETLRRRMKFYRDVRANLEKRYYGDLSPRAIKDKLAELETAADPSAIADEKAAEIEKVIAATARESIEKHKAHAQPPVATLRVDGLTTQQHAFLLKVIKRLKAALLPDKFNDRLLEFFSTWEAELPVEVQQTPRKKPGTSEGQSGVSGVHFPMLAAPVRRKPLVFAGDEDVL